MKCNCDELFSLYKEMFDLHVGTKTNDIVFHKASEGFYETLFDVVHGVSEAMQDTKMNSPINAKSARSQSYDILEKAKGLLESMVNENKDIAMDNVLRGLVDKLGFDCGTARGFYDGNKDEDVTRDKTEAEGEEDSSEEVKEDESKDEEDGEDESEEDKGDVSSYGMAVEITPVEEDDNEELSEEDMKKKMAEKFKKKEKEAMNNEKMW